MERALLQSSNLLARVFDTQVKESLAHKGIIDNIRTMRVCTRRGASWRRWWWLHSLRRKNVRHLLGCLQDAYQLASVLPP